jgi:uncharacterized protein
VPPASFEWDDANIDHVAEHDVEPHEAEEALSDPDRVRAEVYNKPNERRRAFTGVTEEGRLLTVVYTLRRGMIRVVTAREADERETRRYDRRRR